MDKQVIILSLNDDEFNRLNKLDEDDRNYIIDEYLYIALNEAIESFENK